MTTRIETEALQALAEPPHPDYLPVSAKLTIRLDTDAGGRAIYTSRICAQKWHELSALAEGKVTLQPLAAEALETREMIPHMGDLIAHYAVQAATAEHWRQVSVDSLVVVTGLRAELKGAQIALEQAWASNREREGELANARAEIERQREYIAGRVYDC